MAWRERLLARSVNMIEARHDSIVEEWRVIRSIRDYEGL